MKRTFTSLKTSTILLFTFICINSFSQISETWFLDSLNVMEGHTVTVNGDPVVAVTDSGPAVEFDGSPDQLIVDANPLGTAKEFTIEMVFRPTTTTEEPRVLHVGDPSGSGERVTMEIRITGNSWYFDGFINTDVGGLTLIADSLTHPLDEWAHAAVTYENDTFKTFINGVHELTGYMNYNTDIMSVTDKTSLGSRMNNKNYFSGQIRIVKFTQAALTPDQFYQFGTPVSINTMFAQYDFRAYPNPAKDNVNIEFEAEKASEITLVMYDILGAQKMVITQPVVDGLNQININVSHLSDGIYFLNQTDNPKPIMLRVIH